MKDFLAWKWRWLTNLFGFQIGAGAKYYDAEADLIASTVIKELEHVLEQAGYSYLDNYLLKRAEMAGLNHSSLSVSEQQFLGHLAAYYHQISILTTAKGAPIYEAYMTFKRDVQDAELLAKRYEDHRKDMSTVTPTYVPAIINNAYLKFIDQKNIFKMETPDALNHSSLFMCQILQQLYSLPRDQRTSCKNLATEPNLLGVLEKWNSNHHAYEFELDQKSYELKVNEVPQKQLNYKVG